MSKEDLNNIENEEIEVEIEQNQLRERAKKMDDITDERWDKVDKEDNVYIMDEYFASMSHLSPATRVQYESGIKIFLVWNAEHNRNKKLYQITKRDFMKYMTYLIDHGLSSSAIKFKKSSVSSLCIFIESVLIDEMDDYKNFRNFTQNLPTKVNGNSVYEKKLVTKAEYNQMMKVLEEKGDLRGMCWLNLAFTTGARRGELRQFTNDILEKPFEVDKDGNELNFKMTDYIRGKGQGRDGKQVRFMVGIESFKYIEPLVKQNRKKSKSKFLFANTYSGKTSAVSLSWANDFCRRILSPIVGRRINPHLFKASAITHQLMSGKDLKAVSKYIGQHESVDLTLSRYNLQDDDEARNDLFS